MEVWQISADGSSATVTGRTLQPWYKKINPIWWLKNDGEPWPPDWQLPGYPYWIRVISWYLRNPFSNFGSYVIGVSDRNFTVIGMPPVLTTAWNDLPGGRTGWKYSIIHLGYLRLPFVSYVGKHVMWYAGWEAGGYFGFKWNILNSPIQVV
jgi:hypothetical protein